MVRLAIFQYGRNGRLNKGHKIYWPLFDFRKEKENNVRVPWLCTTLETRLVDWCGIKKRAKFLYVRAAVRRGRRNTTGNKNSALAFELYTDCLRKVSFFFNQKIILVYFKRNNALVYLQFTHSSLVSACSNNWKWTLTGVLSLVMNLSKPPLS